MPRPSARVGVLGRWEERINPAPGGVLVIREGNILGTGIIDDTPAVGALVPDDEECNICYWFAICEAPEPYSCLAGQFDFCEFEPLLIYCPGVLPDRPIKIIEVNQSAVYCPGVLPDRPILVYCSLSNSFRPVDPIDGTFTYCTFDLTNSFRPVDPIDGTFTYCTFDLTNSGFDRTP
jgi:hypothetical protein